MTNSPTAGATRPLGLLDLADHDLPSAVLSSWDAFIALVEGADLTARTRLEGWTVREIVLHLGTWDGTSALTGVLESLDADSPVSPTDPDAYNAAVIRAHGNADDAKVLAALRESRDAVGELLASDVATKQGRNLVEGPLGPMPLLTVVNAGCYELAVHALDVADAIGTACDPQLLAHGITALADSTGCLAARSGMDTTVGILAEEAAWAFSAHADGAWTTRKVVGDPHGARIVGSATDLLEASAGRADPVRLITRRHLRISHLSGLVALAPIVDEIPGLPGGPALRIAARSLSGVGSLFGGHGN